MGTTKDYMEFVLGQLHGPWALRCKKMFGEYMVYADDKPVLIVCDNTVFVKMLPCVADLMDGAETAPPYEGAKPHYVLDIEDTEKAAEVVSRVAAVTPVPKPRKKAAKA